MTQHTRRLGRLVAAALAAITAGSVARADEPKPGASDPRPVPADDKIQPDTPPKPTIDSADESVKPRVGPAPSANTQERSLEPVLEKPTPVTSPITRNEITRPTMDKPLIETYLRTWPQHASKAARATIAAYGQPNEATPSMLIWFENGPWHKTIVFKDEVVHDFPRSHYDVLENVVRMKVPLGKVKDVLAFEGSVIIKRTDGLVAVRSNSEAMNYLAINLVNDIVTGKRTTAQARKLYARGVVGIASASPPVAATKLLFQPSDDRAQDPDQPMLKGEYADPGEKTTDDPAAPPAPPLPGPNDLRQPAPRRPGTKPNDLNKPPSPSPTPVPTTPKAVPGTKNGPTGKH